MKFLNFLEGSMKNFDYSLELENILMMSERKSSEGDSYFASFI